MNRHALAPAVLAVFVLALIIMPTVPALATDTGYTVKLTVVGPDNKAVSNVTVVLYDTAGKTYTGETDANGTASIIVPANGTYLAVVKAKYYILDTVSVAGNTTATINATGMHYVNITSKPISVGVDVVLLTFNYTSVKITTNMTVYAPSTVNITFPSEIVKFPYKYVLSNITYNNTTTNKTTVQLDMAKDYSVTAEYIKTFYISLQFWMLAVLVLIIIIALAIVWVAGAKTAKAVITEWREKNRKFVKKKF